VGGKVFSDGGNMMMMMISVLSRQAPRWHDDGAPKDGRVPAWVMVR
jgi:hypothetical protein